MRSVSKAVPEAAEKSDRILFTEVASGHLRPVHQAAPPLLASTGAPWHDVLKLEQHQIPAREVPESCPRDHLLSMRLEPPGVVEFKVAGEGVRRGVVVPGHLHLISQGTPLWWRSHQAATIVFLALEPRFVAAMANLSGSVDGLIFTSRCIFRDTAIAHLLLALRAEVQAGCPAGRLYGESLATALALHLLQRYAVCPPADGNPAGGLPPARLRRVLDYMHAHLGDELTLRQLAEVVQLSPHHFAALFKQSTGCSPYQYLLRQRFATAQHLLAKTRLSLAEISYRLGFSSQAHFTTMFRQHVGTTPGAYRQAH
jgi:AraC family transcriptional regulator